MLEDIHTQPNRLQLPDDEPAWRSGPFTEEDRQIIRSMETVVDGIAAILGMSCEVALHSLEDLNQSIVKIANGMTTGRSVHNPITAGALRQLHEIASQPGSDIRTTFKRTPDGQLLKSTSSVIRNGQNRPIGMLCININMSIPAADFLQAFVGGVDSEMAVTEHFPSSVDDLVESTVDNTIQEINSDHQLSNKVKNKHIIMALYDKGIFDIKESVPLVAGKLGVSKHTVYLYIRQRKSGEG
ncbi:helix-turn-helix transcriptional regulator [Kistimonas asteriae]|uniref:helix-turn-helix transcriptional regulator n=1 Tax=Kistimonas asteriae TaxID=517724 RepID=UPI001BAE30A8